MTYAVVNCINGVYHVVAEGIKTPEAGKVSYHGHCQTLWNAPDVKTAVVKLVDENLDVVDNCREYISHETRETVEE